MDIDTHPIILTIRRCMYLSDRLNYGTLSPDGQSVNPNLILKIGSALLECRRFPQTTIQCSLSELYLLRELTHSVDMMGQEQVGIELLQQIYEGILKLEDKSFIPVPEGSVKEDSYTLRKAKADSVEKSVEQSQNQEHNQEPQRISDDPYQDLYPDYRGL